MTDSGFATLRGSLFVASVSEVSNNDLRVVVVEGVAARTSVETDLGPAFPVEPIGRAFEITWWDYVAYSVCNERYSKLEPGETAGGDRLGVKEGSAYLRYVADSTFASRDYPGPLVHWFLYTEHHCIDVVSIDAPELRELPSDAVRWDLGDRPG